MIFQATNGPILYFFFPPSFHSLFHYCYSCVLWFSWTPNSMVQSPWIFALCPCKSCVSIVAGLHRPQLLMFYSISQFNPTSLLPHIPPSLTHILVNIQHTTKNKTNISMTMPCQIFLYFCF